MIKKFFSAIILGCCMLVASTGFAQDKTAAMQKATDEKILVEYFAKNRIKATRTPSGLYYTIAKQGSGNNAKPGQKVSMKYLGKFMDGKKFDANVDDNFNCSNPLVFTLGTHQVIEGWDEGIQHLNPGTRATLYLPSAIAYGSRSMGPIPANSILVFDVELVSVQN